MSTALTARTANHADARDIFDWRNDAATRRFSGDTAPIEWEQHLEWFGRAIVDPDRSLYIVERTTAHGEEKIGMCRLDTLSADEAEVNINLNPDSRGKGLSRGVLDAALARFRADRARSTEIVARIRPENAASVALFSSAGFEPEPSGDESFLRYRLRLA